MDIYDYLKKDHQKVDELFKQFEKNDDIEYKKEVLAMIIQELTLHSISEQETFYKELCDYAESEEEAEHGWKEHKEIQELMEKIDTPKKLMKGWQGKVLKLKDLVQHHVKEEEGEIFKKAKKVLSEEEAIIIKEKMHDFKVNMKKKMGI